MRENVTTARMLRHPAATVVLLVAVVALLALAVAGPLAAKPATPKAKGFTCAATVVSVDVDARTITATVLKSNRAALVGSEVVFTVLPSARIIKINKTGPTEITLADLAAEDRLRIRGKISPSGAFEAGLVVGRGAKPVKPATTP